MEEKLQAVAVVIIALYIIARLYRWLAGGERQPHHHRRPIQERTGRHGCIISELVVSGSNRRTTRRVYYMTRLQGSLLTITVTAICCIALMRNEGRDATGWTPPDGIIVPSQCTDAGKENSFIIVNGKEYPHPVN
jgi:hypothetical protein